MLCAHDDFPLHQTPEPLAHPVTGDRNFYDRYWFNGVAKDGELYFGVALGLYPNRRVMDASFSVVRDGVQHSLHASRLAPADRGETRVGPLSIEIEQPMRQLRVRVEPNETGIACDLVFRARTAAIEEARQTLRRDGRAIMDATRFTQFGRWQGALVAEGRRSDLAPERVLGVRDRSWGVRPVGEPEPGAPAGPPQVFWLWAPLHFEDRCTLFGRFEDESGAGWHSHGLVVPAYASPDAIPGIEDPARETMSELGHRIRWVPGTRRAAEAELSMRSREGETHRIHVEPLLRFQTLGLGYLNPDWGHGHWKGEQALGAESWKIDDLDPLDLRHNHVQQLVRARWGEREGIGALEQIALGPHAPSGFTGLLDPAR